MNYSIYRLKPYKDQKLFFIAAWLGNHHVNANMVTLAGLVFGLSSAVCLLTRQYVWGLLLISISILADLLDGATARANNSETISGKFLDACCDRAVEVAWVGGLISCSLLPWWGVALPFGSIMLLLARWWAFHHKVETPFVIITRFERMSVMLGMVVIPWKMLMLPLFSIITMGTFISSMIIYKTVWRRARGGYKNTNLTK